MGCHLWKGLSVQPWSFAGKPFEAQTCSGTCPESGLGPWSPSGWLRGSSGSGTWIVRGHAEGRSGSLCRVSFSISPAARSSHPCLLLRPPPWGWQPPLLADRPAALPSTPHARTAHPTLCPPPQPTSAPHSWARLCESCFSAPNTPWCVTRGAAGLLLRLPGPAGRGTQPSLVPPLDISSKSTSNTISLPQP